MIRDAFPDAKVAEFWSEVNKNYGIVIMRNGMYTTFTPEPEVWSAPFKEDTALQIIEQIRQIQHYDVDPFYEPEEKEGGNVTV